MKKYLRKITPLTFLWRKLKQVRLNWTQYQLTKISTPVEFVEFTKKHDYHKFLQYHESDRGAMRQVFLSICDHINLKFENRRFLELGPGWGDPLDIAVEKGAAVADFIDCDPYILKWNRLRGYTGYDINYMFPDGLEPLLTTNIQPYDIIYSKGSINADRMNRGDKADVSFDLWIWQIEALANDGCDIIICPAFDRGDPSNPYICRDVEGLKKSWLTKTLLGLGYTILYIEGFNHPERFPITYYKKQGRKNNE